LKVTLWGTRGSIPSPSTPFFSTSIFGGDTTCVSVEAGNIFIILDAGSGIRRLGHEMARTGKTQSTLFFTHVHWDHIQGFPFFLPAFIPGNRFDLYGPLQKSGPSSVGKVLETTLRGQQEFLTFPVQLTEMAAEMHFHDIDPAKPIVLKNKDHTLQITSAPLIHPGGAFGYRIEERIRGKKQRSVLAFVTDTEHLSEPNPHVQLLMKNADLAIYDAQFTDDEYSGKHGMSRIGWGHSTWTMGLREATEAGAKHLVLTHHDPMHDDAFIKALEKAAAREGRKQGVKITAARQFTEYTI